MHAVRVLKEDHDRIAALVERLAGENDPRLFDLLERELTVHVLAEDNVFLPQVEEAIEDSRRTTQEFFAGETDTLAGAAESIAEARENHREILSLLAEKRRVGIGDLKALVERQVEIEESLYPRAEKVLEGEDFERIGDLIEHCKWQVRGLTQAKLASSSSLRPAREAAVLVDEPGSPQ
ncbi:MAG: hypothetical protein AVDCRST_MAG03-4005 [uncultured Rubrobacteraceae bacterium]|uniref:Hemerythrin-like domain-containing protein n=1 Tax=uncultured Rubrobacteraceae bacterium TaxID=349277 RepID=A0A6J4QF57_9ACTN|nr:MAG: hypothetical protein AVDCRST_MAG03-4005 [uncultured Rubrobacteraceae bacterium]